MDRAADLVSEQVIDELVLLDSGKSGEPFVNDLRSEVVASAR